MIVAPAQHGPASAQPVLFEPADVEAVRARLKSHVESVIGATFEIGPLKRFTVGFSWVTYGFRASWRDAKGAHDRDLILRVGPPNGIFGPYKASPEFLTLQALAGSAVPVPGVYWHSDSDTALGAPFIVCDLVPGEAPIPWTHDGGPAFDDDMRVEIGGQFVNALGALHAHTWQGTPAAYIGGCTDPRRTAVSQVDRWQDQLNQWSPRRVPMMEMAAIWLRDNAPVAPRISITHGDYRIGNFLMVGRRITAILDWELVQLGDPAEDLGWICMQAWRGKLPYMCHFFTREELLERHAAASGIEVDMRSLRYWEAFGTYKLAVMHYGATFSFEKRGFNDLRMAGMGAQIPRVLLQVESAIGRA